MYIRFYFKVILFILALICIACDIDPLSFDNPQDPESGIYLNEIEDIILTSETDTSIAISLGIPEDADKISIERNIITSVSGRDTSIYDFIFYIDKANYGNGIIDTNNIQLDFEYEYIIRNISGEEEDLLYSKSITDTIIHKLSTPNFLDAIEQISATKANITWTFDLTTFNSTEFVEEFIIKRQISSQYGADTTFTVDYGIYEFTDSSVIPHTEYTYTVQAVTKSGNLTLSDSIDFHPIYPELSNRDWVPKSLSDISVEYNFSMGDVQYNNYDLYISRYSEGQDPSEAVVIDITYQEEISSLSLLDILDDPDVKESWYYIVQWCNDSYCESDTMKITTLPFRYMVLVPGVDNYEYGENDYLEAVPVASFYMSIYEVPEYYLEPPDNVEKIQEGNQDLPQNNIDWQDAVDYCNNRTIGIMGIDYNKAGFRLPTKYEWEYAASYNADDNDKDYSFRDFDFINRTIANYYNNDGISRQSVGYFDGEHSDTQDAASFLGIYDLNGNVMEWCSDEGEYSDDTRICKGGGFLTEGSECRNKNEFTYSKDLSHETIGFRTVLSADEFLEYWKGEN
jgi:hypothetical protein